MLTIILVSCGPEDPNNESYTDDRTCVITNLATAEETVLTGINSTRISWNNRYIKIRVDDNQYMYSYEGHAIVCDTR